MRLIVEVHAISAARVDEAAFDEWMDQSNHGLTQVSRILATGP